MPILEPPGFPTGNLATQDVYSISRYLNDPTTVLRALRLIADQIFIGNKVLTGQFYTKDGSVIYEQIESIFAANTPQAVQPGDEYPLTPVPTGPAQMANVVKWGLDTPITDESIARQNFDVVARAFIKIVNSMVAQIDSVVMSAMVAAITQSVNAGASTIGGSSPAGGANWNGSGSNPPKILRDVMFAEELMRSLKQGYRANTVVLDLQTFAAVMGDPNITAALPREDMGAQGVTKNPIFEGIETGLAVRMLGKTWLSTPNLPGGPFEPFAAVLDATIFGAFVDEELPAPGYVGSQSDGSANDDGRSMIQVKTMREDKNDRWRIRARRVTTPIIIEPKAIVQIEGV
ncbi:phage major capsid protein [Mycobacterium botniense]|uniref:Major capsid protein n=1 Tax=Mycobacterium botniense TaxID=84962 RepID=A0A7I9XXB9_9MYCO|nr:hypothetical protein [Mycobacterium botniense]GFG74444.1 hypothetical protein MBOT_18090 [Mycobacterium botniense]